MTAWEFLDRHLFGVGLIVVLVAACGPKLKYTRKTRVCPKCESETNLAPDAKGAE